MKTINSLLETSQSQKTQFTALLHESKADLEEHRTLATEQMEEQLSKTQQALKVQEATLFSELEKETLELTTQLSESQQ